VTTAGIEQAKAALAETTALVGKRESGIVMLAIPATLALTLSVFYLYGYTLPSSASRNAPRRATPSPSVCASGLRRSPPNSAP
jgi:hypothetical protein